VCEEARCPNSGMFLERDSNDSYPGKGLHRNCGFCAVERGIPLTLDESEPERVAEAVSRMHLATWSSLGHTG